MPNSTHEYIGIRTGPFARVSDHLPIHSLVSLHSVPGFCLHRSHARPTKWVVSHIETGASCAVSHTQAQTLRQAQINSVNRWETLAGIERTKEQLRVLGIRL